jgi:ssDNA-binding replication factor A large subunit
MDYDIILQKLTKDAGLTKKEAEQKITDKQKELSNLVSKEGAAYIIAKELGIDMFTKPTVRRIEIKNIVPKIRNLNLRARVSNIFPTKEFESKGRKGKVANVILADQTGTIRMSLWDQQTEMIDKLKPGMAVELFNAYTRENINGGAEVRLSSRGGVKILEDNELPKLKKAPTKSVRKSIGRLKQGEFSEIRAAVVQLFETNFFYDVCPDCGSRVRQEDDYKCEKHGKVTPSKNIVLSGVIDDGTGNIRAVFFRDNALKLIGMSMDEVLEKEDSFFSDLNVLGKEFVMTGRVRKNKMFNRLEFVANNVKEIDIENESNKLINNLASKGY